MSQHLSVSHGCFTVAMNDDTLIRLENLRALGHRPTELAARVGNSKQYWGDLLRGKKSFGERVARKLEEKLGLTRGYLDQPAMDTEKGMEFLNDASVTNGHNDYGRKNAPIEIPTSMDYSSTNLKKAILLMGSLLGALDTRSQIIIGDMLKDLAQHTDEAEDIANKASALATAQKPITSSPVLDRAIKGRRDPVEGPIR